MPPVDPPTPSVGGITAEKVAELRMPYKAASTMANKRRGEARGAVVAFSSGSNDSVAVIQYLIEANLPGTLGVKVAYNDTGWAAPEWQDDEGREIGWSNPPHRSHLCRPEHGGCGSIWRPADVPTEGVAAIKTKGGADYIVPATIPAPAPDGVKERMWLALGAAAARFREYEAHHAAKMAEMCEAAQSLSAPPAPAPAGGVGEITHEDAKAIARRLIAGAFRRDGERLEGGLRPQFSIPCRPDQDDDTRILAYIKQQAALSSTLPPSTRDGMADGLKTRLYELYRDMTVEVQQFGDMPKPVDALLRPYIVHVEAMEKIAQALAGKGA